MAFRQTFIPIWKKIPFLRFLLPLIVGIILEWYFPIPIIVLWVTIIISLITVLLFFFLPFFERFKLSAISGVALTMFFICLGALLIYQKNIHRNKNWFFHSYKNEAQLVVTLLEPLVEKSNSFKANASVDYILINSNFKKTKGKIIIYFQKNSVLQKLNYGSQLVFNKPLQQITNTGNPGAFDYTRYTQFQGITHQVYLKENDFEILPTKKTDKIVQFVFTLRENVLNILRNNIKGKKEFGLAEALLIGYKDDLDKTLVQSYANTGVIHVIAISGLHIGIIYWLLVQFCGLLKKKKYFFIFQPIIIITCLWIFSLLAGAQPSVVRSAVMFTFISLGTTLSRKTTILNSLALSAFLLLCYNPYWLWDVGFQLSYLAVLSIVLFMQPIYSWVYIKNKLLQFVWKLNAVTIAAQLLTLPISIFYFHQFPVYFLLSNFVAVPLSSIILLGEIFLCAISFFPLIAEVLGKILGNLIGVMNNYIENVELLPFSILENLSINILQVILFFAVIGFCCYWLIEKNKFYLKLGLSAISLLFILQSKQLIDTQNQKKIIIYNLPKQTAVDFIHGKNVFFVADSSILNDKIFYNFHIKPSRIYNRITQTKPLENLYQSGNFIQFNNKRILLVDHKMKFNASKEKIEIDILLVTKNSALYFSTLAKIFKINQVVFDGSNSKTKINYWKKDCDSLHIPYHDTNVSGAFVMNLN